MPYSLPSLTPGPLLFNAIYLIRMQFPLGYNYLSILSPPSAGKNALGTEVRSRSAPHPHHTHDT